MATPAPPTSAAPRPSPRPRYKLTRAQRLRGRTRIDDIFHTGKSRNAHPISLRTLRRPDNNPSSMAISIGRRCGNAVQRNLIKRRLREAFRLMQHEIPPGCDYLAVIKPHKPLPMQTYQLRLRQLFL